ncbi:uncharacterized protein METZ01_LOCUS459516, partial [marine metagenome]
VDAFSRALIAGWLANCATPHDMVRPGFDTQWIHSRLNPVRPLTIRHNLPRITVQIVQAPEIRQFCSNRITVELPNIARITLKPRVVRQTFFILPE